MQLWVKRKWKTSRGDISISTADLRTLVADSQYMLVKLSHDELRLLFLVAHAPKGPAFEAATAYWDQLSHAIPASMRSWPLIGLLDANARVGSMTSHASGSHGQDHENIAGECFHQWLHDQSLFLPQMFAEYHHGDHDTWTHSSGTTARLDYIAVDQSLRHDKIPALQMLISPFIMLIIAVFKPASRFGAKSQSLKDRTLPLPQLHVCLTISWACDVHSHAANIQKWMQTSQPQRGKAYCRKHHLRESTWELIQAKRFHWNRLRTSSNSTT